MAEPSSGGTVLARKAGARTPVSSGLTKKEETEIIIQTYGLITRIDEMEGRLKNNTLGSWANIIVAGLNSQSNILRGLNEAQRNKLIAVTESTRIRNGINDLFGESFEKRFVPPKGVAEAISATDLNLKKTKANLAEDIVESNPNIKPEAALNEIQRKLGAIVEASSRNGSALQLNFTAEDLTAIQKVEARNSLARSIQSESLSTLNSVLVSLEQLPNPTSNQQQLIAKLKDPATANRITANVLQYTGNDLSLASPDHKREKVLSDEMNKQYIDNQLKISEDFRKSINSMGIPPVLSKGIAAGLDHFKDMAELGVDGFAARLDEVPVPTSTLLSKQALKQQAQEIVDPQDPLTQEVNRNISKIPRFEAYASAMGFKDIYRAYDYMEEHPETLYNYLDVFKAFPEEFPTMDQNEIAARMKVMASENQNLPIRFAWGKKGVGMSPLERVLGVAINKPETWRGFSGTNTVEQLTNAIQALESDPAAYKAAEERAAAADKVDAEDIQELQFSDQGFDVFNTMNQSREDNALPPLTSEEFFKEFPKDDEANSYLYEEAEASKSAPQLPLETEYTPRQRRRLKRAAERYREQIGGPEATGRDRETFAERRERKGKRLSIEGREPQPFLPVSEPVPEPVPESAPKPKTRPSSFGIGGYLPGPNENKADKETQNKQQKGLAALARKEAESKERLRKLEEMDQRMQEAYEKE
tara:strand:- start:1602 stop:3710 length:2109 start_codon:yes stop_codon:yes gene_type:complete